MESVLFTIVWFLIVSTAGSLTLPRDSERNKSVVRLLNWVIVVLAVIFITALIFYQHEKSENSPKIEETNKETISQKKESEASKNTFKFCWYKRNSNGNSVF